MQDWNQVPQHLVDLLRKLDKIEGKVNRLLGMALGDATRDRDMAKGQEELAAEIQDLSDKVDAYTTDVGRQIQEAVAAAIAANDAEDEAAFRDATKKIDEIGNKLVTFKPSSM